MITKSEKNRAVILSNLSRDSEAYKKIGKNLDDAESRDNSEKLTAARKKVEEEGYISKFTRLSLIILYVFLF